MKKYAAALLTILAVVGLAWGVVLFARMMPRTTIARPPLPTQNPQMTREALNRINGYEQVLNQIDRMKLMPKLAIAQPLAPSAVLPPPVLPGSPGIAGSKVTKAADPSLPVISMVYISSDMKKVVIDGQLLGIGDSLSTGASIADISAEHVIIELRGQRRSIAVPKSPLLGNVARPST